MLDIGTGTGIWAIDFADDHPEASVLGVDLSPIQPSFIPPNLSFEVDDVEQPWTYAEKFDFIYSRMMVGSLADVPKFFKQSFENLTPGGTLEMADVLYPIRLNTGEFPDDCALLKWCVSILLNVSRWADTGRSNLVTQALEKLGRKSDCCLYYKQQMIDAGFTNVVETKYIWPSNRWPKDKKLKELGKTTYYTSASSFFGRFRKTH